MLFNSFKYIVFLPVLLLFYFVLPSKIKNWWLLVCSYYFYMSWNAVYGILLFACTAVSYAGAVFIQKTDGNNKIRKTLLFVTLALLFSSLAFYKYSNFVLQNAFRALRLAGIKLEVVKNAPHLDIVLPVGISFFTFQAAGYVIDVYRKDIEAEHNFFRYALFVSFFPQLVAGPIERSKNLLKQFESAKSFDFNRAKDGVFIMLWGYFLKMVLSDRAAIFVDNAYRNPYETNGMVLIFATIFFAFQIYGDFCGYSLIAKGSAKILGFDLMDNFDSPYCALNVQDFWRRWHISLSSWFKEYLYIPLGGNRRGNVYVNLFIVFLTTGIWHGAAWGYLIWGIWHGIFTLLERFLKNKFPNVKVPKIIGWAYTMLVIFIGFVVFKLEEIEPALEYLSVMFGIKKSI